MCEGRLTADFSSLLVSIGVLLPNSPISGTIRRTPSEQDIIVESRDDEGVKCEPKEDSGLSSASTDVKTKEQNDNESVNCDEISRKSLEMLQSSVFMYRLSNIQKK